MGKHEREPEVPDEQLQDEQQDAAYEQLAVSREGCRIVRRRFHWVDED